MCPFNRVCVFLIFCLITQHDAYCDKVSLLDNLGRAFVFCGGVSKVQFDLVCTSAVRHNTTCLVEKHYPFSMLVSKKCLNWYKLRHNATTEEKEAVTVGYDTCRECNNSYRSVRQTNKRNLDTWSHRPARVQASSTLPISLLSPSRKKQRLANINRQKKKLTSKLTRLSERVEKFSVELNDQQSQQLAEFVDQIPQSELDAAFGQAAEDAGEETADALREAFNADQAKNSKA